MESATFTGEKIQMVKDADPSEAAPGRAPEVDAGAVAREQRPHFVHRYNIAL
jgi:hypothetical protein